MRKRKLLVPALALAALAATSTPAYAWTAWPINCNVVGDEAFKVGTHLKGRALVYCSEPTNITATSTLQYWSTSYDKWISYGTAAKRTTPGTQFTVTKDLACSSSAPYRYWRVYGRVAYNDILSHTRIEYDYSPKVKVKC